MKISFKISSLFLAALILLNVSCKKEITQKTTKEDGISAEFAKQIALGFYNSVAGGISASVTDDGLKANSTKGPVVLDNRNECGSVVKTSTNKSATMGDTTRTTLGNTYFTYLCQTNNWNVDGYSLRDTLTVTDKGAGFKNVFYTAANYTVKLIPNIHTGVYLTGNTNIQQLKLKLNGEVTTESDRITTNYNWNNILVKHAEDDYQTILLAGRVGFSTLLIHRYGNDVNNTYPTGGYSGYVEFLEDSMLRASFFNEDRTSTKNFLINLKTGEVKAL